MSEEKVSFSSNENKDKNVRSAGPGEVGYTPPTEIVPLPSMGKVYPLDSPLNMVEVIEIRSMTARDEDILTSRALLKQGKAISALLKNCIANKSVDPDKMLSGDRNAALVAIRITGYGSDYAVNIECPKCEEKVKHSFDLSQLPIKPLGVDPVRANENIFLFRLPVSGKDVYFKLFTGDDERELSTILEKTRKAVGIGGIDNSVTTRLLCNIISLGGENDRGKLSNIIRNIPARDSRELRSYIEKISPGIEMKQNFMCSQCGEEAEVDVPMGTEFFWPGS